MSQQTIPNPTDDEVMIAAMAFDFITEANKEPEKLKQAFVNVYAQQIAEIRWLRSLLGPEA